ncbi:MAG: nuclear transport factor 2 family protein [Streptosporangiales bacterium]
MAEAATALERACATTERYRRAGEDHDLDGVLATLAPDVVLNSPVTLRARFHGRDAVRDLFCAVFAVLGPIEYHSDVGDDRTRALFYRATVRGQSVEEAVLVQLDEQARIAELTLWMRPLPGLVALVAALGPELARRSGRPWMAGAIAALTTPLTVATRATDRLAARLLPAHRD